MKLREFMNDFGSEQFEVIRNSETVGTFEGLANSSDGKKMVQFFDSADVLPEDWIISKKTMEKLYIDDVTFSRGFDDEIFSKNAYYLTESQYKKSQKEQNASVTFQIGDVQNSIIGTQHNATLTNNFSDKQISDYIENNCGEDKELMQDMLKSVNAVIENNIPVQKGTFSRFSEASSKYAWLLGAVTTKLLTHFFK